VSVISDKQDCKGRFLFHICKKKCYFSVPDMEKKRSYVQVLLPLKMSKELSYSVPEEYDGEISIGSWVQVKLVGKSRYAIVTGISQQPPADVNPSGIRAVESLLDMPPVTSARLNFWRSLADYYMCSVGEVFKAAYSTAFRKQIKVRSRKSDKEIREPDFSTIPPLSPAQQEACDTIRGHFTGGRRVLLRGVTGSGKTEIYFHLMRDVFQSGGSVLFLVPEIAISRQLTSRLEKVFGSSLLPYHSKQTAPTKKRIYNRLVAAERPYVVLGTRSALLLPLPNLSLIVVDEEHDSSYKQSDPAPRYNGRDGALMLSSQTGANLVLGSATPSFESLYNVSIGKLAQVDLMEKFHKAEDAQVEIVDMVTARRLRNVKGPFSIRLLNEIGRVVNDGGQVMVFRSRRAYAPYAQCAECGSVVKCPSCDVALSYHKFDNILKCHYCSYQIPFELKCPQCASTSVVDRGAGTEKIEELLREYFPDYVTERFDSDTISGKREEQRILRSFADGEIDILVGTQMITKGFDFDRLSLVAVIGCDSLFSVQDFRADERALQLLWQLRGRAGRREDGARMIIQTEQKEHPVLKALIGESDAEDLSAALAERKKFGYPPFVRLVVITLKDKNEKRMWSCAYEMADVIRGIGIKDFNGPLIPPIAKTGDYYQVQFRLRLKRNNSLSRIKKALYLETELLDRKYSGLTAIGIDVDPY
jgi:primosomal protein N' (replication factor Y)